MKVSLGLSGYGNARTFTPTRSLPTNRCY